MKIQFYIERHLDGLEIHFVNGNNDRPLLFYILPHECIGTAHDFEDEHHHRGLRLDHIAQQYFVAFLIVRFAIFNEELCVFEWLLARRACEALRMVLAPKRRDEVVDDRLLASLAPGLVEGDVAFLAVGIAFVDDKLHSSMFDFAILVCSHEARVGAGCRSSCFGVEERVTAVGTEEMQLMIASLLGLTILSGEFLVLNGNVAFVNDWSATVEAALGEEFVIVKVTVRKTFVLIESNMLKAF